MDIEAWVPNFEKVFGGHFAKSEQVERGKAVVDLEVVAVIWLVCKVAAHANVFRG